VTAGGPTGRRIVRSRLSCTLGLVVVAAGGATAEAAQTGWRRLEIPATAGYALRYLPPGLDQSQPAPVIVFLHGSGGLPEHYQLQLVSPADEVGAVLLLPKSVSDLGFGPGEDRETVEEALSLLGEELSLDGRRIALAGHSGGGAYAAVLAYASRLGFSGVFILAAPYRIVLGLADPDYTPPIRLYYGDQDPNYQGGHHQAFAEQWERLGVPWEMEIAAGYGHSTWPETTLPQGFAFLLAQRYATAGGCLPSDTRLCLRQGRFAVEATWRRPEGQSGPARVTEARTPDSGLFYFFRPGNWELQVKVLDGCAVNGRYWVFAAGTTDVEYTLTVEDLAAGVEAAYSKPQGVVAPAITDVNALATCP
jgi:predicted esterase